MARGGGGRGGGGGGGGEESAGAAAEAGEDRVKRVGGGAWGLPVRGAFVWHWHTAQPSATETIKWECDESGLWDTFTLVM